MFSFELRLDNVIVAVVAVSRAQDAQGGRSVERGRSCRDAPIIYSNPTVFPLPGYLATTNKHPIVYAYTGSALDRKETLQIRPPPPRSCSHDITERDTQCISLSEH